METHILSILVDNEAGVLGRVVGLISRRGFNIDSLAVGETGDRTLSRMTVRVTCEARSLGQIVAQVGKLVCVRRVAVLPAQSALSRELLLLKVATSSETRSEVLELAGVFRARVVDVSRESLTLEMTGESDKMEAIIGLMEQFGILEMARTGASSLSRGPGTIYSEGC